MLYDGKIMLGAGYDGPDYLVPEMAIRHGLISGATGTGKTICLKVLAEGFSELGIPVLLTDIKGDLSGMVLPGESNAENIERLKKCGIDPEGFEYKSYPTTFWDAFGHVGHPVRATVLLSMNAYTPYEQQNIGKIAKGLPSNPRFDVAKEITLMAKGDALVSFMDRDGRLDITRKITILPPKSYIGDISKEIIAMIIKASPFNGRYDDVIDYYSAYEKLQADEHIPIMDL